MFFFEKLQLVPTSHISAPCNLSPVSKTAHLGFATCLTNRYQCLFNLSSFNVHINLDFHHGPISLRLPSSLLPLSMHVLMPTFSARAFWTAAGLLTLAGLAARASVIPEKRQSIATLSSTSVADFLPYTYFAAAAYCPASSTVSWTCGSKCLCSFLNYAGK